MTPQQENAAILLNLWNIGERAFDGMLATVTKLVDEVETRANFPKCQFTDSTGYYVCGQPSTVFDLELECYGCLRCYLVHP